MIKITKERYGKDFSKTREAFRIRVTADESDKFNDFHLKIELPADEKIKKLYKYELSGINAYTVLLPTNKKLEKRQFHKRNPASRLWKGTFKGWRAPKSNSAKAAKNTRYLSFISEDKKRMHTELIFDLVIHDITWVKHWWATKDGMYTPFAPGKASIVKHGETVKINSNSKKLVSTIPDFKLTKEQKKDIKQLKSIINPIFKQFDTEVIINALSDVFWENGFYLDIEEKPDFVDMEGTAEWL